MDVHHFTWCKLMREIRFHHRLLSTMDFCLAGGWDPGHVAQCDAIQISLDEVLAEEHMSHVTLLHLGSAS